MSPAYLEISGLRKEYRRHGGFFGGGASSVVALHGVDLEVIRGEVLALVGESGCGKTTLARCVLRVIEPTAGRITLAGTDLTALRGRDLRRQRRRFQSVFQDPSGSLDPRQRVRSILAEPIALHFAPSRSELEAQVDRLLASVGLPRGHAGRWPHQLSGGERQRVGIARALASEPELVIADEPVSALDVSLRAQVLNLLADLRRDRGLTVLLISHDLAAVERLADRVAVLYLGRIVEIAARKDLFATPLHPYTRSLLAAAPSTVPRRMAGKARVPWVVGEASASPAVEEGCPFEPRCPVAQPRCRVERPELLPVREGGHAACFYPGEGPPPLVAPPGA
jgi:oligopeptide/dipeptide ABC transporter ATP-binding protein